MNPIPTEVGTSPQKLFRVILAALIALTLVPIGVFTNPDKAYAADIPNVGDTYYGSCYIENSWIIGSVSYFNMSGFTGELTGCEAVGSWQCADPTAAEPTYVGATYSAKVTAVNVAEGWVEYYVYVTPPGATNGIDRDPATGWLYGYQHVDGKAHVKKDFGGYIELFKNSSNTDITNENACYSFEGGVFNVYNSAGKQVATLTTNKDGWAKTSERLPFGWYNVVESKAPKGFVLDQSDHWVEITAANDATAKLHVSDKPQGDPAMVAVGKIDKDTTLALPQGDTSLTGAEFTLNYFDGYYKTEAEALKSGTPTRTWVLRTDESGQAHLRDTYLVAGSDALYRNSYGDATIPLGTVVIKETKAPADYVLPVPVPVSVQQVTSNTTLENVTTYNAPRIADVVKRGDIAITKAYDDSPDEDTGIMIPEEGIVFDFYDSHQFEGSTPLEGVIPAFSLTTDEFGRADTKGLYVIENEDGTYSQRPRKTDDSGALPHDTYLMVQTTAVEGLEKIPPTLIYVSENAKTYDYLLQNGAIQTPLKVVKVDSETGEVVPYPASWQIVDRATNEPVSMTTRYPVTETFDVFTSDDQGRLTLPEKLAYGEYELKEVEAPANNGIGYLLNSVNVCFHTEDGYDWDNPLEIVFEDAPAKGQIEILKTDAYNDEPVNSATYVIQASEDIYTLDGTLRVSSGEVVDTLTTDESGYALSKELYLGHYDVIEAISPEGFALDTARHSVDLEYADQLTPMVSETLEVADNPTTLRIAKIDERTGEPMADVSFLLVSEDGSFEETLKTDEAGIVEITHLPHESFNVTEIETPFGYVHNDQVYSFTIDDQGLIEGCSVYTIEVTNTPINVVISKIDITTQADIPGCQLEIYKLDEKGLPAEEPIFAWVTDYEPYEIVGGLMPGNYLLRETLATPGFVTAEEIIFSVEDTGEIQTVVMEDDYTKLEISKRDVANEEELPGAKMAVYKAGEDEKRTGEALYEWTSTTVPYQIERIEPGEYILREDTAPLGYELAQDVLFTIAETGETHRVVMYDAPIPDEPKTPGKDYDKTGFDPTLLVAVLVVLGAGGLLGLGVGIKRHHKHVQERETAGEFEIPRGEDTLEEDLFDTEE